MFRMSKFFTLTIVSLMTFALNAVATDKNMSVIDMHIHSYSEHAPYGIEDHYGVQGPTNRKAHFEATFKQFQKHNIVKAVVAGSVKSVDQWQSWDENNIIIRGIYMSHPESASVSTSEFEKLIINKKVEIFGELGPYYSGTTLSDDVWQPYLALCEKYDIPVAVHTGGGDPGGTYSHSPNARLTLGDPYLIEDVLVNYPKLRIYMMHSGEDWHEHALRLMAYYPNLYSGLGAMLWVEPLTQRYAKEFLSNAKQAGYLNRVMFGSDQMFWPYAIDKSINYLNSLAFLTEKDKRDILYNNAVNFLKRSELTGLPL